MGFPHELGNPLHPASDARPVTPGAAMDTCRALYIGTGGTLNFTTANGTVLTGVVVPSGCVLPIAAASVEEGGDADDILALY